MSAQASTAPIATGDKVEFDDGYGEWITGTIAEVLPYGKVMIRYGRGDRALYVFDMDKDHVTLICRACGEAKPDAVATEYEHAADIIDTDGTRVVLCDDCREERNDI